MSSRTILSLLLWVALPGGLAAASQEPEPSEEKPFPGENSPPEAVPAGQEEPLRSERLRRRRLQRFNTLQPYQLRTAQRVFLWVEKQITEVQPAPSVDEAEKFMGLTSSGMFGLLGLDYRDRLFPRAGSMRSGSGIGGGLRLWEPSLRGSRLDLELTADATFKRYQFYRLRFGKLQLTPEFAPDLPAGSVLPRQSRFFVYSDVRYLHFPGEQFYGPGMDSRRGNRSDFLLEEASYTAVSGFRVDPHFTLAIQAGLSQYRVDAGGDRRFTNTEVIFDVDTAPGLERQPDFFRLGGALLLDLRDVPGNPHKGAFVGLSYTRFDDLRSDDFPFQNVLLDARAYLPLGSPQRVLALNFLTSVNEADAGARVPFFLQPTLGGKRTLRGFPSYRFRDESFLHLAAEYRWEAAPAVELAVFYDTGKVFEDLDQFRFEGLQKSIGFGMRFKTGQSAFLRLDVARSGEGTRFHFTVGHPF